jgi:hypothetical protein
LQVKRTRAGRVPEAAHFTGGDPAKAKAGDKPYRYLDERVDVYNLAEVLWALLGRPLAWRHPDLHAGGDDFSERPIGFRHPAGSNVLCVRGRVGTCELWWVISTM